MSDEFVHFFRQNIGIRYKVIFLAAVLLLCLHVVEAEAVLPRDFKGLGKMVNFLELVKLLEN